MVSMLCCWTADTLKVTSAEVWLPFNSTATISETGMYFKNITKETYSTSLTQPTSLKLNWAIGSVITEGCRSWLWFLMTQKFISFKTQIFTLRASIGCPCNIVLIYVAWTEVPVHWSQYAFSYFGSWKSQKLKQFCLKRGVETRERLPWDTDALKTCWSWKDKAARSYIFWDFRNYSYSIDY